MRVVVVGTGYVGLTTAVCLAEIGHEVEGVDIDAAKVQMIRHGESPIYEPGLQELLQRNLREGRLRFTTELRGALSGIDVLFSCVATPRGKNHAADLRAVLAVVDTVGQHAQRDLVFVNKSTVPVGTGQKCDVRLRNLLTSRGLPLHLPVVSNPEFLREGEAVQDTLHPDRIIIGTVDAAARRILAELYAPIARTGRHPLLFTSRESAELIKYASNTFLATKISFINMLSEFCEKCGASVKEVAEGMGLDDRIGPRFLHAGIGYGGSCFPKDIAALRVMGRAWEVPVPIIDATMAVNQHQRQRFFRTILRALPSRPVVAVWGLSFKPKTDDLREAPSVDLLPLLLRRKAMVRVFDPVAMPRLKREHQPTVTYATSPLGAAKGADAVVLLTEWDEFRGIDLGKLAATMRGHHLFDGRNVYDPRLAKEAGLTYHGIGMGGEH